MGERIEIKEKRIMQTQIKGKNALSYSTQQHNYD